MDGLRNRGSVIHLKGKVLKAQINQEILRVLRQHRDHWIQLRLNLTINRNDLFVQITNSAWPWVWGTSGADDRGPNWCIQKKRSSQVLKLATQPYKSELNFCKTGAEDSFHREQQCDCRDTTLSAWRGWGGLSLKLRLNYTKWKVREKHFKRQCLPLFSWCAWTLLCSAHRRHLYLRLLKALSNTHLVNFHRFLWPLVLGFEVKFFLSCPHRKTKKLSCLDLRVVLPRCITLALVPR